MKRIYYYLIGFIVLFGVSFVIYQSNIEESSEVEPVLEEPLVIDSVESSSESISVASLDDSVEAESESPTIWRGPSTTYLNADEEVIQLASNLGKPTLINIWATWCPPCRDEMPYFDTAYQEYGDEIEFVMINALNSRPTETKEAALAFVDEMELTMPIYFDQNGSNQLEFTANMLPLTALLDADGEVIEVVRGQVSPAKLKQLIGKVS